MQADYLQIVIVLAFIVGLIFVMAWFARRLSTGRTHDANAIAVVATRFLGPKEKLMLVDVEGTRVLIGINGQSMTSLCTMARRDGAFATVLDDVQMTSPKPAGDSPAGALA